jgi:hypothetical protein
VKKEYTEMKGTMLPQAKAAFCVSPIVKELLTTVVARSATNMHEAHFQIIFIYF